MKIVIDAINIRSGGGLTYLINFLKNIDPNKNKNIKITIFISPSVSKILPKMSFIKLIEYKFFDWCFPFPSLVQQLLFLKKRINKEHDLLYSPGGTIPFFSKIPIITMSQNLLPFDFDQAKLFGFFNLMFYKMLFLRFIQAASFRSSDAIIFLHSYAKDKIEKNLKYKFKFSKIIPHGIESRFINKNRKYLSIKKFSHDKPFKFLYISTLMPYKHQLEVMIAIFNLKKRGYPVNLTLVGSSFKSYSNKLKIISKKMDPDKSFINFIEHIRYDNLHNHYSKYDGFIFASSCENLPIILLEAMLSGLPIACSNLPPMNNILGNNGFYFNPYNAGSIEKSLETMIKNPDKQKIYACRALNNVKYYSWKENSSSTINFFREVLDSKLL